MKTPLLPGNDIRLLENGLDFFPALIEAIEAARFEVRLETYIFERDDAGEAVLSALLNAVRRGVAVHLVVDGFGARDFVERSLPELVPLGLQVLVFRREVGLLTLGRHRLRRLHRKLACIDAQIAFVGGINIIDDMNTPRQMPPRVDYAVKVIGPLVAPIHTSMCNLWNRLRWIALKQRPQKSARRLRPIVEPAGNVRAAFVVRDNLRHRGDIENAYLEGLRLARRDVIIASAYFFPGRRFRNALLDAAERGVRVTLLLQGRVEYWLLHHACHVLYPTLLAAGIHIVEYRKSFLHAKVAVIDDDWATVGSSNIDPFSLLLAREANVVVRDPAFTTRLRASLQHVMQDGGETLDAAHWQQRSPLVRAAKWCAYMLMRALIGLAGFGRRHERL